MITQLRAALVALLTLTFLTGVLYPLAVTGVAKAAFPERARGSLIVREGKVRGSALEGQAWDDPKYFWGRPSATAPFPYNANGSAGSNLGPTNPALTDAIKGRVLALREADPRNVAPVPIDLVTTSGSGLDPHISPAAARYQLSRVARLRGRSEADIARLVSRFTEGPTLGVLGEARVNVTLLNLALDELK
ncbi:MAG: potassium-transporting ATPase subunit KdpC [Polyangiaceae bacterium]